MTLECNVCHARYTIEACLIPAEGSRVRCRACGTIFRVERPPAEEPSPAVDASARPPVPASVSTETPAQAMEPDTPAVATSVMAEGARPSNETWRPPSERDGEDPMPRGLAPEERARHERARRLARVLASDMAIYNREKRDRGIREGNLVALLGYEIKKSWEVYKDRVGVDLANATPYFRDALNEMLAEGKKIF